MSQKSIKALKHDLLDFADNIDNHHFSALSSGVGIGELVPKKKTMVHIDKNNDDVSNLQVTAMKPSEKKNHRPGATSNKTSDGLSTPEYDDFSSVAKLKSKKKNKSKFRSGKRSQKPQKAKKQKPTAMKIMLTHLIDLSIASLSFFLVFLAVLGHQANWDKVFLVEVIEDLGVAYLALFSYGAFILYHFVFRMLRIRSLGKIITRRQNLPSALSPKTEKAN